MTVSRTLATRLAIVSMLLAGGPALAADHLEAPLARANALADIADVYTWMSPDAQRVNLVMTVGFDVSPSAQFSDSVEYVFKTSSQASYSPATVGTTSEDVTCSFSASQVVTCSVAGVSVTGNASSTAGISDSSGRLRVFAGPRNDPFFFNFTGFRAVAETVVGAAPSLDFDAAGCPTLDMATSNALVTQLQREPDDDNNPDTPLPPAVDDFAAMNVLALVVSVDKSLLTAGGSILSVSGVSNLIGG